jgi:hypothetical protein
MAIHDLPCVGPGVCLTRRRIASAATRNARRRTGRPTSARVSSSTAKTIKLSQTGHALRGTVKLTGGLMYRGDKCTTQKRGGYTFNVTGKAAGTSAALTSDWGDSSLKRTGTAITASFTSKTANLSVHAALR